VRVKKGNKSPFLPLYKRGTREWAANGDCKVKPYRLPFTKGDGEGLVPSLNLSHKGREVIRRIRFISI